MGLIGDIGSAYGISKSGIAAGVAKSLGVNEQLAHAAALAFEVSKAASADGFDLSKADTVALARHAMLSFGMGDRPMLALAAGIGLRAVAGFLPAGGKTVSGLAAGAGVLGAGAAALGAGGFATSALGGLANMQLGIGNMASVLAGAMGMKPNDLINGGIRFFGGDKTATMRGLMGMQRTQGAPGSQLSALPRPCYFEDLIAALMIDHLKDQQEKIEERARDLLNRSKDADKATSQAKGSAVATGGQVSDKVKDANTAAQTGTAESRNIEFEIIKNEIQKLSQMQQALSNVLNTMHEQSMGAIRQIKA